MKPYVYIHLWRGRDEETRARCAEISAEMEKAIRDSGLEKAAVMRPISSDAANEIPTLAWMHYDAHSMDYDTPILYMHLKGASWRHGQRETACVEDWRRLMLYYCVERWEMALEKLKAYSAVGVNVSTARNRPHFSGNFWWAKAGAVVALPKPDYAWNRMEGEFWIGGVGYDRMGSLHQSRVDHYFQPYPRELYAGVPV